MSRSYFSWGRQWACTGENLLGWRFKVSIGIDLATTLSARTGSKPTRCGYRFLWLSTWKKVFFQALCSSRKPLLSVRGGACQCCFFLRLQHPKACAWPWPHPCSRPWSLATGTCGILPQCWPRNLYLSLSLSLVGQQLRNYRRWFHCSRLGSRPSLRQRRNQRAST